MGHTGRGRAVLQVETHAGASSPYVKLTQGVSRSRRMVPLPVR